MTIDYMCYHRHVNQDAIDILRKCNEDRKEWLNRVGVNPAKDILFCMTKAIISCFIAENQAITKAIQEEKEREHASLEKMMRNNSNQFGGQNL